MARPLRIEYPGAFYHVTSRGNERKAVFKSRRDREKFLEYLESASERYGAIIHIYCLMDNYHLLIETPAGNLAQIMQHINGAYTTYLTLPAAHREPQDLGQAARNALAFQFVCREIVDIARICFSDVLVNGKRYTVLKAGPRASTFAMICHAFNGLMDSGLSWNAFWTKTIGLWSLRGRCRNSNSKGTPTRRIHATACSRA